MQRADGEAAVTVMYAGHVFAHALGGADDQVNLIPLCTSCNGAMGRCPDAYAWILAQWDKAKRRWECADFNRHYEAWKSWFASL